MSRPKRPQAYGMSEASEAEADFDSAAAETARTLELREEQLVAHKDMRDLGEIEVRTDVDEVPARLEVTKRLVLRERMRVRRVGVTERQLYQDTLRRERVVVEDPDHTGLVREQYRVGVSDSSEEDENVDRFERAEPESGFLGSLVRKALE